MSATQANPDRPELFFALVCPMGAPRDGLLSALRGELARVGYTLAPLLRLSELLHRFQDYSELEGADLQEDARIEMHMNAGDDLRRRFEDAGVLGRLAVEAISEQRATLREDVSTAWLLDSLKHKKELEVLRKLYGESLIVISLYDDQDKRERALAVRITRSWGSKHGALERARKLIERDQEGSDEDSYGQDVRRAFPLADYFISCGQDVGPQVARLVDTLFGHPTRSPSRDEYAMAVARSAALRSADLSRQVGAAIVDDDGEIVAAGCNEVPKPGGGVYWEGDDPDSRDFNLGYDPNEAQSREMLVELFERLGKKGWLSSKAKKVGPERLARTARKEKVLERARVVSLVEFGRIVHAEANAVLRAASAGIAIRGMRMVCTTFPCHVCARHLLGVGLAEVVYIEPYPKSLATEQYPEAISVGEGEPSGRLRFRPFMGWAPSRYLRVFEFGTRKGDDGHLGVWDAMHAEPKLARVAQDYTEVELAHIEKMRGLFWELGIKRVEGRRERERAESK